MTETKKLTAEELSGLENLCTEMGETEFEDRLLNDVESLLAHIAALDQELAMLQDAHDPIETPQEAREAYTQQLGVQITEMLVELEQAGYSIMARKVRKYVRELEQDCNAGASMLANLHDRYNALEEWQRNALKVTTQLEAALDAENSKSQQRKKALKRVQFAYRTEKGWYCIRCFEPKTRGCLPNCIIKLALED